MVGRFGKYGDLKRRKALQRGRKDKAKLAKISSVDRRNRRRIIPSAHTSLHPEDQKRHKTGGMIMEPRQCRLKEQGLTPGSCAVQVGNHRALACRATLNEDSKDLRRLVSAVHLSRPENYLSIYQSGCNLACRKCHSWSFSKVKQGYWCRPQDILRAAKTYERQVTLVEPRERATAWHAHESCRCCGACIAHGRPSAACPGKLTPEQICFGPQGFGPARNIVAFTGGDLSCCPDFYAQCAERIKSHTQLWVLIETNGYGLTVNNLDILQRRGVDAFWLDIKAWNDKTHRWLTGGTNAQILGLPAKILKRGFVLEVLSLYIPQVVEGDQLDKIARHLAAVDSTIPFTILAFFPEHRMLRYRAPDTSEMIAAYHSAKTAGLQNVRLGNLGVFVRTEEDIDLLTRSVPLEGR
jgi:pyruvate-formate lyase-activating enzyme